MNDDFFFKQLDFSHSDDDEEDGGKNKTAVIKAFKQNKVIDVTPFGALQERPEGIHHSYWFPLSIYSLRTKT